MGPLAKVRLMGAITFSIDPDLVRCLKRALPLTTFVETGTFEGESTALALPFFDRIYTVEQSAEYYLQARQRFADQPSVSVHHDGSEHFLRAFAERLRS